MKQNMNFLVALIMTLSGNVWASDAVNTVENRQFLKQQETLSQQSRDRPDTQLKTWAEQQIQDNPLQQSDRHYLDDLVRKQQSLQTEKPAS
ncbi:type-F conjugative transfer system pilin assembly protein TrbC, partial [Salmonella enterica]|nr:type-F conjugative transfer system pilin assembly protein TrbC [Salmonella enterica]